MQKLYICQVLLEIYYLALGAVFYLKVLLPLPLLYELADLPRLPISIAIIVHC